VPIAAPRAAPQTFWLPALAALAAILSAAFVILPTAEFGSFSRHMALHIAAMNVLAPLTATAVLLAVRGRGSRGAFWMAAAMQVALLWAWHLPVLQEFSGHGGAGPLLMHGSLFFAALAFWTSLLRLQGWERWHGVLGLLVTGKFSCLLAALLVFAPRPLFAIGHHAPQSLVDQQLAGLLMLTACPLSYVVAGVVMTAQLVMGLPMRSDPHVRQI